MPSVTAGTIKDKVQVAMGDLTKTFIEDNDVYGWMFDACQEIAKITECLTKDSTFLGVANQELYALDNAVLRIVRVTYNDRQLEATSMAMLDSIDPNRDVAGNTGKPTHYFMDGGYMGLWKRPTNLGGIVKYRARILPTKPLVAPGDVLEIPDFFQTNVIGYCVIQARQKDEAPEMMAILMETWKNSLATAKNIMDNPESSYPTVRDIESMVDYTTDWYS